ncbi:MFS transporter [Exiguobacterium flavidum]|uniref:MFS transporter n=1 Tax=Exiguobacterium flavidum TaxID=2184695 RepID=UPI000DF791F4|nr:MFS transporter [Exiguobacterium flavidum]
MKRFYILLVSQWLANVGDVLYIIALIAMLFEQTGSALGAASFPVAVTLGMTLSGFFFARVARTLPHRHTLMVTQVLKTLLLAVIMMRDMGEAALVLVALIAFLDGFARPIQGALVPVLHPDQLKANSLVQGSNQLIQLIMWPLGAILVSLFTTGQVLLISFAFFGLATFGTYLFMRAMRDTKVPAEEESAHLTLRSSISYVKRDAMARSSSLLVGADAFAGTVWISALFLLYIEFHLEADKYWWGILNAVYMLSMILSSVYLFRKGTKRSFLVLSAVCSVAAALLFGWAPHVLLALVACGIQGAASQVRVIQTNTLLQEKLPNEKLPYVYSIQQTSYTLAFCLGSLTFGLLADHLAIELVYMIGGGAGLAIVWYAAKLHRLAQMHQNEENHVMEHAL